MNSSRPPHLAVPSPADDPGGAARWMRRMPAGIVFALLLGLGGGLLLGLAGLQGATGVASAGQRADGGRAPISGDGVHDRAVAQRLPESYDLVDVWATPAERPGLYHPAGVALSSDGGVYVAERGNHRIGVWGISGRTRGSWGGPGDGPGEFREPSDVALSSDETRAYVADTGNRRVEVLHATSGVHIASWHDVGHPVGITTSDDDRVFVSDAEDDRILVFDADGQRLATWGGPSDPREPEDAFRHPRGLAWSDGSLYVADHDNLRVQVLDGNGATYETIDLSMRDGPGGAPLDVAVSGGTVYVALERAVVRIGAGGTVVEEIPPLREKVEPECRICESCRTFPPAIDVHEGVAGVAAMPGVGMVFTYAPSMRPHDRVVVFPERGPEHVFPSWICGIPSHTHLYDAHRLDVGDPPRYAHVLDQSGRQRILEADGRWWDAHRDRNYGPGLDVATEPGDTRISVVLTGNQVEVHDLLDFVNLEGVSVEILDERQRSVRNRVGEFVPDWRWWLDRVAFRAGTISALDRGHSRVVLRGVNGTLIGGVALTAPSDPPRSFSDLAYDHIGRLWVLARDGQVIGLDRFGRDAGTVTLSGIGDRTLEALAADATGYFTISGDGWLFKHDPDGNLRAAWRPDEAAGPGRYRDVAVGSDGRVLVPDGAGDRVLVFAPGGDPAERPGPPGSTCRLVVDKHAAPSRVDIDDPVTVTLTARAECGPELVDIVVAYDASCQVSGDRLRALRDAASALVDGLDFDRHRLGFVAYNDQPGSARQVAALSDDRGVLEGAAGELESACRPFQLFPSRRNDARAAAGLRAAREVLHGPDGREDARKVALFVSASALHRERHEDMFGRRLEGALLGPVTHRTQAMWEAWRMWSDGIEVRAYGLEIGSRPLGPPPRRTPPPPSTPDLQSHHPPDDGLLSAVVSPADRYVRADPPAALEAAWRSLAADLAERPVLSDLTITDVLPADMQRVPGAEVPAATVEVDRLNWSLGALAAGNSVTVALRVRPQLPGMRDTNVEAHAGYIDPAGERRSETYPVPRIEVLAPPTATPTSSATAVIEDTPPPASETATPEPTSPPAPSATVGPSPVVPRTVYLPAALQHRCRPTAAALDVVLLLDSSSSMQGAKLDAARQAAGQMLALLDLPKDRVAIVTFDRRARVLAGLGANERVLRDALRGIRTDVGTRIDLGIHAATDVLARDRRPRTDRVMILLTDGHPAEGTEDAAVDGAIQARRSGIDLWAIGLGGEVPLELMRRITADPTQVLLAPTPGDLVGAYERIARILPCR